MLNADEKKRKPGKLEGGKLFYTELLTWDLSVRDPPATTSLHCDRRYSGEVPPAWKPRPSHKSQCTRLRVGSRQFDAWAEDGLQPELPALSLSWDGGLFAAL